MRRFVEGVDRSQTTLFPDSLDDWVSEDNPVRVIDAFVDAGEKLKDHYTDIENGLVLRRYWTTACHTCPMTSRCTTAKERRITRWEHEDVLEAVQRRLNLNPGAMRQRREMALPVLAYNLTRLLNILGVKPVVADLWV